MLISEQTTQSILARAVENGSIEFLQLLAADKRFPDNGLCIALYTAAAMKDASLIEFILNNPSFNHADHDALGFKIVAKYGHAEHFRLGLASSSIDPTVYENIAICVAARNGHVELLKY